VAEPVAELFAELGLRVPTGAFDVAVAGFARIGEAATAAMVSVEALAARMAGLGGFAPAAFAGVPGAGVAAHGEAHAPAAEAHAPAAHAPAGGAHGGGGHGSGGHGGLGLGGLLGTAQHMLHGYLAIFAGHEILHFAEGLTEAGVQAKLTSEKLGITTAAVQQLQYAASLKAIDKGELGVGLRFLQVNAAAAAKGTKAQAGVFKSLGISVKDAHGEILPVDELLGTVADKIAAVKDPAQQTAMAVKIFGRSGQQLLPLLKEGSKGIAEFREEAIALGGGLDEHLIEHAEEFEHSMKRFEFAFIGVKNAIGNVLLPALTKLFNLFTKGVAWFNDIRKHTKLLETALAVGLTVAVMKAVVALEAMGSTAALAWVKSVFGFILLAAVIAGVVIVLEDLYTTLTGGRGQLAVWLDQWKGMGATSELIKNMRIGIDALKESIAQLFKTPLKWFKDLGNAIVAPFKEAMHATDGGRWDIDEKGNSFQTVNGKRRYASTTDSDNELANRNVAEGHGVNANAHGSIDIARAERGTAGKLKDGSKHFAQARASVFDTTAPLGTDSPSVVVNVKTDASPKEIGRHVAKALDAHVEAQNKRLRNTLVPDATEPDETGDEQ
jgi:hypothetical protein